MQRRALIVNDEKATSELITRVLYTTGIEALTVTRSSDAVTFLQEGKFDVIFMDFHLTSPNGVELVRQIRGSGSNRAIPIVLISGENDPTALGQGFDAGASFFLYKPIDQRSLLRLIRAASGAMEHESRRTRRVPIQSRVCLRTGEQVIEGQTEDVSLSGMRVRMPASVPVGSSVHVTFYPHAGARPIVGRGSVVRLVAPGRMGIQLSNLSFAESERLQEFLLPLIPTQ